jgi:hypothetical protein
MSRGDERPQILDEGALHGRVGGVEPDIAASAEHAFASKRGEFNFGLI